MANTVVINYGRKRTDKLPDGAFDSLEVGGAITLEVDGNVDPADVWEVGFGELKERVDRWAREESPVQPAPQGPLQAVPQPTFVTQPDPNVQSTPPAPTQGGGNWVQKAVQQNTQAIQERMTAPPAQQTQGGSLQPMDDRGTPPASAIVPMQAVMYAGCKVFDVQIKKASNGNDFCAIRIGKSGPDGIPGQYATARSFEPDIVNIARTVREGDFVDVYGFWKPWNNNPDRHDLELQKIERNSG